MSHWSPPSSPIIADIKVEPLRYDVYTNAISTLLPLMIDVSSYLGQLEKHADFASHRNKCLCEYVCIERMCALSKVLIREFP